MRQQNGCSTESVWWCHQASNFSADFDKVQEWIQKAEAKMDETAHSYQWLCNNELVSGSTGQGDTRATVSRLMAV